jgi:hypothetical protein
MLRLAGYWQQLLGIITDYVIVGSETNSYEAASRNVARLPAKMANVQHIIPVLPIGS